MLGTIQAESRLVMSCLARYRQNHVGYNTDGVSDIGYNTDRLTLCIIQNHVGYDTGGITLGSVTLLQYRHNHVEKSSYTIVSSQ